MTEVKYKDLPGDTIHCVFENDNMVINKRLSGGYVMMLKHSAGQYKWYLLTEEEMQARVRFAKGNP
ncbi:MAG: hypothetical protein HQL06_16735 [Nitrospirae bacterium]|nr:hypothetical protein [Nitrospirota bacterium]